MAKAVHRVILTSISAGLLLCIAACSSLYVARNNFSPPLPVKLVVRNDAYGSGYFGAKRSGGRRHNGIDFLADVGTPVLAAKGGRVSDAGYKKGNGKYVVLGHLWGYRTYYCHLSEISVKRGEWVRQGRVIGYAGKTGNANYAGMIAHLHFELRRDGVAEDPAAFINVEKM